MKTERSLEVDARNATHRTTTTIPPQLLPRLQSWTYDERTAAQNGVTERALIYTYLSCVRSASSVRRFCTVTVLAIPYTHLEHARLDSLRYVKDAVQPVESSEACQQEERQLRRAGNRDDRVSRTQSAKHKANGKWLDRVVFLQDNLPDTLHPLDLAEIHDLLKDFVARHDQEIEQLKSERRAGRPASNRQTLLEQLVDSERKEYDSGFWMPNLQDEETLVKLDKWNGDWSGLTNLRYIRLSANSDLKESAFPPRGAS
ncbi:hypothetical protein AMS68_006110 [Peltaster fructicola]|uniref:Uncharacterized protein n=1 Tax=Peltaster fructicola TaxID=286661 RepID=A0A6H0Y0Q7_9PEZI|nr:hypothetical protein AMS68_006110 [Peltaster fructicola]